MEPIWGSFDSDGNPLMVPFEGGFGNTRIDSRQQTQVTQPGNETAVDPSFPHTPNLGGYYLSPSASPAPFGSRYVPGVGSYNDGLKPRDPAALNISRECPGELLTSSSSYVGTNTSSLADSWVIHEDQFGGLAQIPTMSQNERFDEPPNNQQTWEYQPKNANTYNPSIHNDYFLPQGAASATSSLSEYSDASSYCSRASSQSWSWPPVFLNDPGPPPQIKSGLFGKLQKRIDEKAHKCTVCDKQFNRLSSLQVHSYRHTGETRRISILSIGT
jgi:hypothetical protein